MEEYPEPLDLSLPSVKLKNRQSLSDIPLDLSKKRIDNPQIMQMGPFSNSIMKNIPNFSCDKRPRAHQSSGASSLSYINQSPKPRNAHSCIPVRNPYPDNYEDELESVETPFNFSSRYAETKNITNGQTIDRSNDNYNEKKIENKNENFTIYAETDLDQPTDYSLRYAENNRESDSEVSEDDDEDDDSDDNEEKTAASEFVGDTVKTYCTEGTPYETPFNFSTSTSMSDLRISEKGAVDVDTQGRKTKIQENIPENGKNDKNSGEKITHNRPQTPKMKSEFNSGLTSPEKPMNYCEEGTPGYFSRVSSFGSLNSAAAGSGEEKSSEEKDKCSDQMKTPKKNKLHQKLPGSEVKVVKFESSINYCEETPLMFSRSSSLGSVGSIEQSMHDEGSSVVSDFSRLTSGIISPSEIPDSPTQTVPPSPKQRKSDPGLNMRRHSSARRSLPTKSSVFEDGVTKFKEENTPAQFSLATSLSSLNIDDHEADQGELNGKCVNGSINNEENVVIINVDDSSSEDEEDEVSFHNNQENIQNRDFSLSGNRQFQSNLQDSKSPVYAERSKLFSTRALSPPSPSDNNVRCYNTEDTPAVLSRNESISELSLSTLSILDEEPTSNRAYLSENSSAGSVDNRVNNEKRSEDRNVLNDVWARTESKQKPDSNLYRQFDNLPPFLESKDEYCQFAVEDSPAQFSLRSSLSRLTMESDIPSGILDFSLSKETPESPNNVHDNHTSNTSQKSQEHVPNAEIQEEESFDVQHIEETDINSEKVPTIPQCPNEEENVNVSNENSKSIEMKYDDSRCNSMKKKKWKWKWQFGSEDGQHSESGESAMTDKQSSSNIEEFDQGRRSRVDKNTGSLDASFRKKKWWKWKFGSKEKEQVNVEEAVDKAVKDEAQTSNYNDEEKDTNSKEDGSLETRNNKSKRWKWKWKLGFKDDDSSKSEKCSLGLSKLKHHVSPETSKEPITIADVLHSADVPKEMNSLIRFLPEKQTVEEIEPKVIRVSDEPVIKLPVPVREKLATPEPSDSEHSVIIEEINEHYSSDDEEPSENNNAVNSIYSSDNTGTYHDNNIAEAKPNYEISLDEYIQLGMPKNKIPTKAPILRISPHSEINKDNIKPNNLKDFLEECIQLGLPKNKVPSKVSVSSNHSVSLRSSPKLTSGHLKSESNHVIDANQYRDSSGNLSNHSNQALRNANRMTNFESSSLNRLSLEKMRKKEFNSNDNILTGLSKQSSDRLKNVRGPTYGKVGDNNAHGYVRTASNTNKVPTKADDDLTDGKIGQREMFNSQLNRTVSKILDSSSSSSRSDTFLPMSKDMDAASGHKDTSLKSMYPSNSGKKPDYASVIEECIQLGMPKRKDSSKEIISPTSLIHHKMMHGKRWPEYVSRIANENKCASLPKPSSNRTSQNYCASDEEFSASDLQIKRDMILRHTMDNNTNRNTFTKAKVPERKQERPFYSQPKSEFKENVPVKYNTTRNTQRMEEFIDSVYSNVDEPKNYSKPSNKELYSRGSTTDRMNRQQAELSSKRGEVGLEGTSNLIEDCIKLGIPIKKLQEIRRSVGRSSSQEILQKYDMNEDINRKADSEDDAVYANTTERYSSFKNQGKTHRMTERNEKPLNPKCYDVREASISPILPDTYNKNWKNNLRTETTSKIPKKAETAVDPVNNPDFAAIIEECIQLGMPKRKEFSGEMLNSNLSLASSNSRSNSAKRFPDYPSNVSVESHRSSTLPKNSTHCTNSQNYYSSNEDFTRPGSQRKISTKQHLMNTSGTYAVDKSLSNIPQKDPSKVSHRLSPHMDSTSPAHVPNYHLEINKTTSQISNPEESMYVNVSNRPGYSRSTSRQSPSIDIMSLPGKANLSYKSNYSKTEEPDYSAVLEECIKLGMPRRKFNEAQRYLKSLNPSVPDPEESSVKYGSPNSMDSDDMQLYVNTSIVKDSISERGLDRRPRVSLPPILRNKIEKLDINSSTIEKALEECIQLGWPKRTEYGKDPPVQFSTSPPTETYMQKPTEKSVSKNVNVASVVRNMQTPLACSKQASMTAGAEVNSELQNVSMIDVEEILTNKEKNGYEENNLKSSIYSDDNHAESEMSFASLADIDVKLLDPQIVLQSLEKYTEKLISEAELIINSKSIKV